MKTLEWKKEYELGIQEIDSQHQELVKLINDLHDAKLEGVSRDGFDRIIERLQEYINKHFSFEEKLMKDANYEKFDSHCEGHRNFVNMVDSYRKLYQSNDTEVISSMHDFLKIWLTSHILASDREYVPALKNSGTA